MSEDFQALMPVMYKALGSLGKRGFLVPPDEGRELINDFFAYEWKGVEDRFDPEKGSREAYVYSAFRYFAQGRVLADRRRQRLLQPLSPAEVEASTSASSFTSHDAKLVRAAFSALPESDRQVLRLRVVEGVSERAAASTVGVSRFLLRKMAAEALGRFAVALDERGEIQKREWKLARELWGEARSVEDVAAELQITVPQARAAKKRLLDQLANCVGNFSSFGQGDAMKSANRESPEYGIDVPDLLQRLKESPADVRAADEVAEHLPGILRYLEDHPDHAELPPVVIARLYDAFAGHVTEETLREIEKLNRAAESKRREVEQLVTQGILELVPTRHRAPEWLDQAGGPWAVFSLCNGVSTVLRRLARGRDHVPEFVLKTDGTIVHEDTVVKAGAVRAELRRLMGCDETVVEAALVWLVESARSVNGLIIDAVAEPTPEQDAVRIRLIDSSRIADLERHWIDNVLSAGHGNTYITMGSG